MKKIKKKEKKMNDFLRILFILDIICFIIFISTSVLAFYFSPIILWIKFLVTAFFSGICFISLTLVIIGNDGE